MKRFWLVLLSLGLIAAFSTQALAVDVKVSGQFYVAGMYIDKTNVWKNEATSNLSTAFFYQRLRLTTNFVVSPGLTLTVRTDIMDREWGARTAGEQPYDSAATRSENENIAIDHMYVTYASPIGIFAVGPMNDYAWGTQFGDRSKPSLKITYTKLLGPVALGVQIAKETDRSKSAVTPAATYVDGDADSFIAFANYTFKMGSAGYLFRGNRNATNKQAGLTLNTYSHVPYAKVKIGPVALEAEANYTHGSFDYEGSYTAKIDSWAAYLNAGADFGVAYVGGTFAYVGGQINPDETIHRRRTGLLTAGTDWNPCLIMWNNERSYVAGPITNAGVLANLSNTEGMSNVFFFQAKGGVRPIDKLDINLAIAYANAVVKPTAAHLYNDYGWEVDATATYKITNNLSYMLGAGYLFTGKYFKGTSETNELQNTYLLINKLALTF